MTTLFYEKINKCYQECLDIKNKNPFIKNKYTNDNNDDWIDLFADLIEYKKKYSLNNIKIDCYELLLEIIGDKTDDEFDKIYYKYINYNKYNSIKFIEYCSSTNNEDFLCGLYREIRHLPEVINKDKNDYYNIIKGVKELNERLKRLEEKDFRNC